MVITIFRIHPPDDELLAEIVLAEDKYSIPTLTIERYPVRFGEEEIEVTAYFAPHNHAMTLVIFQQNKRIAEFMFCCPIPCNLAFPLSSAHTLRVFCDPKQ